MSGLTDSHWKDVVFISPGLMRHADYLQGTGRCNEAKILCERTLETLGSRVGEDHERYGYVMHYYEKCLLAPRSLVL